MVEKVKLQASNDGETWHTVSVIYRGVPPAADMAEMDIERDYLRAVGFEDGGRSTVIDIVRDGEVVTP